MFCSDMCLILMTYFGFLATIGKCEGVKQFEWVGWEGNLLQVNRPDIPMGYVTLMID